MVWLTYAIPCAQSAVIGSSSCDFLGICLAAVNFRDSRIVAPYRAHGTQPSSFFFMVDCANWLGVQISLLGALYPSQTPPCDRTAQLRSSQCWQSVVPSWTHSLPRSMMSSPRLCRHMAIDLFATWKVCATSSSVCALWKDLGLTDAVWLFESQGYDLSDPTGLFAAFESCSFCNSSGKSDAWAIKLG